MFDKSEFVKRPDAEPGPSDDFLPRDISHGRISAVGTVVPVISHQKIFVIPQFDLFVGSSRILNDLLSVFFLQDLPIDQDIPFFVDPDRLTRQRR